MSSYATDGLCHNAEPGTFNHECGRPATWLGTKPNGFQSGFCDDCKAHGHEAGRYTTWTVHPKASRQEQGQIAAKIELTEIGEQFVMPGCERIVAKRGSQLKLWE